jgi:hypothetical protein
MLREFLLDHRIAANEIIFARIAYAYVSWQKYGRNTLTTYGHKQLVQFRYVVYRA